MKKRIISLALAVVMIMAMTVSASAAELTPSATNQAPTVEGSDFVAVGVADATGDKKAELEAAQKGIENMDLTEVADQFPAGTKAEDLKVVSMFDVSSADGSPVTGTVTFTIDASNLPNPCVVFHWENDQWVPCPSTRSGNSLTITSNGLSPFAIVADAGSTGTGNGNAVPTGYDFTPVVVLALALTACAVTFGFKRKAI